MSVLIRTDPKEKKRSGGLEIFFKDEEHIPLDKSTFEQTNSVGS